MTSSFNTLLPFSTPIHSAYPDPRSLLSSSAASPAPPSTLGTQQTTVFGQKQIIDLTFRNETPQTDPEQLAKDKAAIDQAQINAEAISHRLNIERCALQTAQRNLKKAQDLQRQQNLDDAATLRQQADLALPEEALALQTEAEQYESQIASYKQLTYLEQVVQVKENTVEKLKKKKEKAQDLLTTLQKTLNKKTTQSPLNQTAKLRESTRSFQSKKRSSECAALEEQRITYFKRLNQEEIDQLKKKKPQIVTQLEKMRLSQKELEQANQYQRDLLQKISDAERDPLQRASVKTLRKEMEKQCVIIEQIQIKLKQQKKYLEKEKRGLSQIVLHEYEIEATPIPSFEQPTPSSFPSLLSSPLRQPSTPQSTTQCLSSFIHTLHREDPKFEELFKYAVFGNNPSEKNSSEVEAPITTPSDVSLTPPTPTLAPFSPFSPLSPFMAQISTTPPKTPIPFVLPSS